VFLLLEQFHEYLVLNVAMFSNPSVARDASHLHNHASGPSAVDTGTFTWFARYPSKSVLYCMQDNSLWGVCITQAFGANIVLKLF
jgi:hypothetical protein